MSTYLLFFQYTNSFHYFRVVMKSLVLGYFSTPPGQKAEVIRLLARVLDFNQEEMEKVFQFKCDC